MKKRKTILNILFGLCIIFFIIFMSLINPFKSKIKKTITKYKITVKIKPKTLISLNNFDYSNLINTNKNYCGKDLLFIAFVPSSQN